MLGNRCCVGRAVRTPLSHGQGGHGLLLPLPQGERPATTGVSVRTRRFLPKGASSCAF